MLAGALAVLPSSSPARSSEEPVANLLGRGLQWDHDRGLAAEVVGGVGYGTRLGKGTWAHATRSNIDYAARLLSVPDAGEGHARARRIINEVIGLQNTDPQSPWYGTWPWYVEEPLARMSTPDLNWAIFIGNRLAEILLINERALPDDLKARVLTSLRHACVSFVRRGVGTTYTNVYISGARLVTIGGEILSDTHFVRYGRDSVRKLLDVATAQGAFTEYNSPDYTVFDLTEVEALLRFAKDRSARTSAEALRRLIWKFIADYFHPATGEWAGPHDRAYTDRLSSDLRAQLSVRTGLRLTGPSSTIARDGKALVCPIGLKGRFMRLPWPEEFKRLQFVNGDGGQPIHGARWMVEEACLGSVSSSSLWHQRHPIIAFWQAKGGSALFRVQCLKDGRDFASFGVSTVQDHGRALVSVHPIAGAGDWHLFLDRTKNGVYAGSELRVRFLVDGVGARIDGVSDGIYELVCGDWKAVIATGPTMFGGRQDAGTWQVRQAGNTVSLDYVIALRGTVAPESLTSTLISAAISLQKTKVGVRSGGPIIGGQGAGWMKLDWDGLSLITPDRAGPGPS